MSSPPAIDMRGGPWGYMAGFPLCLGGISRVIKEGFQIYFKSKLVSLFVLALDMCDLGFTNCTQTIALAQRKIYLN